MNSFTHKTYDVTVSKNKRESDTYNGRLKNEKLVFTIQYHSSNYQQVIYITHLKVEKEFRYQGFGLKVLAVFENWAKTKGFKKIIGEIPNNKNDEYYSNAKDLEKFYKKAEYKIGNTKTNIACYATITKEI